MPTKSDSVNHPKHYNVHPANVECIDVVEHFTFNIGNAIKYLWRAGLKGDLIEDLRKGAWYVEREIERLAKAKAKTEPKTAPGTEVTPEFHDAIDDRPAWDMVEKWMVEHGLASEHAGSVKHYDLARKITALVQESVRVSAESHRAAMQQLWERDRDLQQLRDRLAIKPT